MDLGNLLKTVAGAVGVGAEANASEPAAADSLHGGMAGALIGLVAGHSGQPAGGGLASLVQMFDQQGLGHLVSSWIGSGQNLAVSPEQVENTLGSDRLTQLAEQAGIPSGMASTAVSALLPGLIDKLTPNGSIENGLLEAGLNLLRAKMG